jgi:hypothetical protein
MSVDSENTMRRLREQLPIATNRIWCLLGWHRWTVWSERYKKSGDVSVERQYRHCVNCNEGHERTI